MNVRRVKEAIIIGFALFAMFFGAGNLIFPPALGATSGEQWFAAFMGFFSMDALLALLGVFAMISYKGDVNRVGEHLGKRVSTLLTVAIVLCIGPCIAIPRTATVSFSMGLEPLLGEEGKYTLALAVFSAVFFAVVFALSVRPSHVVDIIGKYLTPVLILFLLIMIVMGIIYGKYEVASALVDSPIKVGVSNGYQTMDGMAALLFSGMIIESAMKDETKTPARGRKKIIFASCIAAFLLFIVYAGLTYLGRLWGVPLGETLLTGKIDQAELLTTIVEEIMGKAGVYILGIVTLFACLTTAIGLVTASADFFSSLLNNKITYETLCLIVCLCGMVLSNFGLSTIISLANPILLLIYPPVTVLIILGVFQERIHGKEPFALGAGFAFAVSFLEFLCDTVKLQFISFIHELPLSEYGLGFVLPAAVGVAIGFALSTRGKSSKDS